MASRFPRLGILPEAEKIARHANERFADPRGFEHYVKGVRPDDLDAYVDGVLEGVVPNVEKRYLDRGRIGYWDPDKKAVIIEEGDGGTVFTPTEGKTYFDELD
ncbi:hypothetical protein ABZW11_05055 [Nonomuraea sp. NPDC004580]|uniref:hypothetical protein n=1 Tax=Nonomuraea sp. NPDC004580 TaxID=3154552 RepID=UPI0033A5FD6D